MKPSVRAAYCGILAALAVVMLLTVPVVPVMLYCAPILSGVCVAVAAEEFGWKYAFAVYAAVSLVSLMVVADKEAVCVFVLLSGAYAVIKAALKGGNDKLIGKFAVIFITKLAYINVACVAYYFIAVVLLGVPRDSFGGAKFAAVLLIVGNIVMLAYDKAIDSMIAVYKIKLRKHIMKGKW